jgi:hypothetical protein
LNEWKAEMDRILRVQLRSIAAAATAAGHPALAMEIESAIGAYERRVLPKAQVGVYRYELTADEVDRHDGDTVVKLIAAGRRVLPPRDRD